MSFATATIRLGVGCFGHILIIRRATFYRPLIVCSIRWRRHTLGVVLRFFHTNNPSIFIDIEAATILITINAQLLAVMRQICGVIKLCQFDWFVTLCCACSVCKNRRKRCHYKSNCQMGN